MTEESRDGAGGDDAFRTLISDDASTYLQRKCLLWRHLEDEVGLNPHERRLCEFAMGSTIRRKWRRGPRKK